MKRILVLVPSLKDVSPVKAAVTLSTGLSQYFEIIFVSYDTPEGVSNDLQNELRINNIKFECLNCNGFKDIFAARKKLENIIRDYSIDLCLSFLIRSDILLAITRSKVVKVSSIRNMLEKEYVSTYGDFLGRFFGFIQSYFLKRFDCIVVMSSDMKDFLLLKGFALSKLRLIFNFLDQSRLQSKSNYDVGRVFNNEFPVLISISSLQPRKCLDKLIYYALCLYESGVFFNLMILGSGSDEERLKKMVNDSSTGYQYIRFIGHVDNPIPYLKQADIFVMASESEGVSRAFMEALHFGKKCIVSDIPGNRELASKADGAYLFCSQSDFKESLFSALEYDGCISLPNEYSEENGINHFRNLFESLLVKGYSN